MSKGRSFGVKRLPLAVPRRFSLFRSLHTSGIIWCVSGLSQPVMNSRTLVIDFLLRRECIGIGRHIGGTGLWLQARPRRRNSRMVLRLASFKADGRASYGAVTDAGIIDLGKKLSKY